jgi:hypothetical protein
MFNYLFVLETYEPVAKDTCPPTPFGNILKFWIFSIEACRIFGHRYSGTEYIHLFFQHYENNTAYRILKLLFTA